MVRKGQGLTEREEQVLELLRQGHSQVKIAALLCIEVATVHQYTWILRSKMQVDSTYALVLRPLTITDEGAC